MAKLIRHSPYAITMSYRAKGTVNKTINHQPTPHDLSREIMNIELGKVEYVSLQGPEEDNVRLEILGKPGAYHLTIFIDEYEEYIFSNGSSNKEKVDISGDYWPANHICSSVNQVLEIAQHFYKHGEPLKSYQWLYYCEDDE